MASTVLSLHCKEIGTVRKLVTVSLLKYHMLCSSVILCMQTMHAEFSACVCVHLSSAVEIEGVSVSAVYGLASKPLYMAMEAVTDLLTAYLAPGDTPRPLSPPDTAIGPDFIFLQRFTLLAAHTMFAQQHWEGLISAGLRLCEVVRKGGGDKVRGWVGDLVPVILNAQRQLSERVREHSLDLKRKGE